MSQKISFKQPNKYSQNSPECRILTLEFQNFSRGQTPLDNPPPPPMSPSALNYILLFKIVIHLFSKKLLKILSNLSHVDVLMISTRTCLKFTVYRNIVDTIKKNFLNCERHFKISCFTIWTTRQIYSLL